MQDPASSSSKFLYINLFLWNILLGLFLFWRKRDSPPRNGRLVKHLKALDILKCMYRHMPINRLWELLRTKRPAVPLCLVPTERVQWKGSVLIFCAWKSEFWCSAPQNIRETRHISDSTEKTKNQSLNNREKCSLF